MRIAIYVEVDDLEDDTYVPLIQAKVEDAIKVVLPYNTITTSIEEN